VNSDIVPSQQKLGIILENKLIAKSVDNKKKWALKSILNEKQKHSDNF